ncbi:hypothetical protein [Granulicella paludicola]|uniref:hypothetical protein n=1 Tax=Granulicella paludicola TaxID=474951 RepID=UPI0021DFD4D6|nr:hypothetical protein [Granulicella paludicola]
MRSLLLALLLATASFGQAPHHDPFAALKPSTPAERAVLAALQQGSSHLIADPQDNKLSGEFVRSVMFIDASAIPSNALTFQGFSISLVSMIDDHPAVTLALHFLNCDFPEGGNFGGNFTRSLNFDTSTFKGSLRFNGIRSQANILLTAISFPKSASLLLSDVQTTGDIYLNLAAAQPTNVSLLSLKSNSFDFIDLHPGLKRVQIRSGTFDSAQMQFPASSPNTELDFMSSTVAHWLRISGTLKDLYLDSTTVAGTAQIQSLPTDTLELDSATFNLLALKSDPVQLTHTFRTPTTTLRLPSTISLAGASFSHISFAVTDAKTATGQSAVNGLPFFQHAVFYQPALLKYQTQLQDEGNTEDAATMNRLIHQIMRSQAVHDSPWLIPRLKACVLYGLDFFQQWVFGYGVSIIPPFVSAALFIALGTLVFFRKHVMEPVAADCVPPSPNYSGFWYSLELFLPVVELGVAKFWRPRAGEDHRILYARIHQLAGWILIPVMLGVLTGSLK